jgi:two-component system response regulator
MNAKAVSAKHVLLVEDDAGDVVLARESLSNLQVPLELSVVRDGVEAMYFLRREGAYIDAIRPDFVILDLNLPRMDGWAVLRSVKSDERFKSIPVIVLTTSKSDVDIRAAYQLGANCFISKPPGLVGYEAAMQRLGEFWLHIAKLPDA